MVIAINTRILSGDAAAATVLVRYFEEVAAAHSQHRFYFISNGETLPVPALPNIQVIVLKQQTKNPLLWKLWYNYTLPSLLRKIKAAVLVSADGVGSLRTKIPQYILINDLDALDHPETYNKRYLSFIRSHLPLIMQKAAGMVTFSGVVKNGIINRLGADESKIIVTAFKNKKYGPITWEQKQKVKDSYTNGNEYFLYSGPIQERSNLTNLLKAFSLFKKRQKSSMQLVLHTAAIPEKNAFVESLRLYKYREEVKLIEGLAEAGVMLLAASACSVVSLSPLYSDINFLQQALLCDVPVIAPGTAQAKELLKDAALYVNAASVDSIAGQLMLMYKDENRQNELVANGKMINQDVQGPGLWDQLTAAV